MLMSAGTSCLLVVDVQARLLPKVATPDVVMRNNTLLITAARRLGVPILCSEQYPKGLGTTVPELKALLSEEETVEKLHFSCMGEAAFAARFRDLGRPQAVVTGLEAHVCVLQTVLGLVAGGTETFVVEDATSSRVPASRETAMRRMRDVGARVVTTEMVVFEWLAKAGTPEFREISPLIK